MKRFVLASALLVALGGCAPIFVDNGRGYNPGPPDHAPAHGYRKKVGSHALMFDSNVGVYVVVGSTGLYFWDDFYWRLRDGLWHRASGFDGPWVVIDGSQRQVPPGLAKKYGYGKSQNNGKAKGKDKK